MVFSSNSPNPAINNWSQQGVTWKDKCVDKPVWTHSAALMSAAHIEGT